jgi:hypothetical protein
VAWVYDVGENSDCSVDARISDNIPDLVEAFRDLPWDPRGAARIRFSLMPPSDSRLLDLRASTVADRIAAVDEFVAAGWEVHVNLSRPSSSATAGSTTGPSCWTSSPTAPARRFSARPRRRSSS